MKTKKMLGISLIVLVITIVVMIILATATAMVITNDNPIDRAKKVKLQNDLSAIRENVQLYINKKYNETNGAFKKEQLTADKNGFTYNDGNEEKTDSFLDIIGEEYESYKDKVWIEKGVLIYLIQEEKEQKWAEEIGIQVLSVLIDKNGRLLCVYDVSSLIDNDGVLRIPSMVKTITKGAFAGININIKKIIIPGTCEVIEEYAFYNQKQIEEVVLEYGIKTLGKSVFAGCTSLKNISLPDSITQLDTGVFFECTGLEEVKFSNGVKVIPNYTFHENSSLKKITGIENIEEIGKFSFGNCSSLTELNLSGKVSKIDSGAFSGCTNINLTIDENNPNFTITNNTLCTKDKTKILQIFNAEGIVEYEVPEGVIDIGNALDSCDNLEKLKLPASLKTLTVQVLSSRKKLNSVEISENNLNFSSDGEAIYNKNQTALIYLVSNPKSYTVKSSVKTLQSYSLGNKSNLSEITLPNGLEAIKDHAFNGSRKLEKIELGANVNYLTGLSFYGTNLYRDNKLYISIDAANKKYVIENDFLLNIDKKTLISYLGNKSDVVVPDGVETISTYAFHNKRSLKNLTLPSTLQTIGGSFQLCVLLESITIPSSVTSIASNCFASTTNLKQIIIERKQGQAEISGAPWGNAYGTKIVEWKTVE